MGLMLSRNRLRSFVSLILSFALLFLFCAPWARQVSAGLDIKTERSIGHAAAKWPGTSAAEFERSAFVPGSSRSSSLMTSPERTIDAFAGPRNSLLKILPAAANAQATPSPSQSGKMAGLTPAPPPEMLERQSKGGQFKVSAPPVTTSAPGPNLPNLDQSRRGGTG